MKHLTKIIFVDGPTGVGKDYFIDRLTNSLEINHPKLTYEVLRAADFVLKDAKSEDRKYTLYQTETEKIFSIFTGHINLLCYINEVLNSPQKDTDLVIVNRSFLSFLIYNINPIIRNYANTSDNEIHKIRDDLLNTYANLFKNLFYNTGSIFIKLTTEDYSLEETHRRILDRIRSRNDNKPIDETWLETLVRDFHSPSDTFLELFAEVESITSNGHDYILRKYL